MYIYILPTECFKFEMIHVLLFCPLFSPSRAYRYTRQDIQRKSLCIVVDGLCIRLVLGPPDPHRQRHCDGHGGEVPSTLTAWDAINGQTTILNRICWPSTICLFRNNMPLRRYVWIFEVLVVHIPAVEEIRWNTWRWSILPLTLANLSLSDCMDWLSSLFRENNNFQIVG